MATPEEKAAAKLATMTDEEKNKVLRDMIQKIKLSHEKMAVTPDIHKLQGILNEQMNEQRKKSPEWYERDGYNETDDETLAVTAFNSYRLWLYKREYKIVDPFPTNIPNAARYRDAFNQSQTTKNKKGFPSFVMDFMEKIKQTIGAVHYTVMCAFTQHQEQHLMSEKMLDIDFNDKVQVAMTAAFKLECERLCILFSDVCSGMFVSREVQDPNFPDDPTKTIDELYVQQIPPYIMQFKTFDDFNKLKLQQYINNYRLGVNCCVMALQLQSVFESIKNERVEKAKRPEDRESEFPEMYRVPYRSFMKYFAPFIKDNQIKANAHVKNLLRWVEHELRIVFDDILIENRLGDDVYTYQRPIEDEFEIPRLKAQGVKPTYLYEDNYFELMQKICKTSIRRRSPALRKEIAAASLKVQANSDIPHLKIRLVNSTYYKLAKTRAFGDELFKCFEAKKNKESGVAEEKIELD